MSGEEKCVFIDICFCATKLLHIFDLRYFDILHYSTCIGSEP